MVRLWVVSTGKASMDSMQCTSASRIVARRTSPIHIKPVSYQTFLSLTPAVPNSFLIALYSQSLSADSTSGNSTDVEQKYYLPPRFPYSSKKQNLNLS